MSRMALPLLLLATGCDAWDAAQFHPYEPDYASSIHVETPGGGPEYGAELLPLGGDNAWLYVTHGGWTPGDRRIRAGHLKLWTRAGPQPVHGRSGWAVQLTDEAQTYDLYMAVDSAAVWFYGQQNATFPSPVPLVVFPARAAKTWTSYSSETGLRTEGSIGAPEAVGTPMGLFEALPVRVRIMDRLDPRTLDTAIDVWFVPGLGIVKQRGLDPLHRQYLLRWFDVGDEHAELRDAHRLDLEGAP